MLNYDENNNYEGIFSVEEINKLINELKEEQVPLTKKTLNMIKENRNVVVRQKEEIKFNWLNELYVIPLIEFAKRVSLSEGKAFVNNYNSSDSSIMERMLRLRNFLVQKGYSTEAITQLVPKSVEEIDILLQAAKFCFSLRFDNINDLSNDNRVKRAKNYLAIKAALATNKENDKDGKTK